MTNVNVTNTISPSFQSGTANGLAVPYAGRTFYLYNNAVSLATSLSTATCTSGTSWNGSTCVTATSINGVCGSADNTTYPYNWPGYGSDTFCESGTQSPSVISFPAPGGTANWECLHVTSGTDSICSASQDAAPSGGSVSCSTTTINTCTQGTLDASSESSTSSQWTWICDSVPSGSTASCSIFKMKPTYIEQ